MRKTLIIIGCLFLSAGPAIASSMAQKDGVLVDPSYKICAQDSDCAMVSGSCSGCDGGAAIHKSHLDDFLELRKSLIDDLMIKEGVTNNTTIKDVIKTSNKNSMSYKLKVVIQISK